MIRIHVSAAAYQAIAGGVPEDSRLPPLRSSQGGFFLWLDKVTVNQLKAARRPSEGFSEAILRLAEVEA
jgi:hypothetical protein